MRAVIDWLERVAVAINMRRFNKLLKWLFAIIGAAFLAIAIYSEVRWYFINRHLFGR